ncbi:MAG: archaemetzincin [Bacteroidota bacterium]
MKKTIDETILILLMGAVNSWLFKCTLTFRQAQGDQARGRHAESIEAWWEANYFMPSLISAIFIAVMLFIIVSCAGKSSSDTLYSEADIVADTNVYIAFASYDNFDTTLVRLVMENAEKFYSTKSQPVVAASLPDNAYNAAWNRYSADSLLIQLNRLKPPKADFMQGLTDRDIFTPTEKYPFWGIFGLGSFTYPVSVVSTFRLHAGNCSDEKFRERLIKVALHEVGHNLGLHHCPTESCMMESAEGTIVTVDNEKISVCENCKQLLREKFKTLRND